MDIALQLTSRVSLEVRGAALWRRSDARMDAVGEAYTFASPLWLGNASLAARF